MCPNDLYRYEIYYPVAGMHQLIFVGFTELLVLEIKKKRNGYSDSPKCVVNWKLRKKKFFHSTPVR